MSEGARAGGEATPPGAIRIDDPDDTRVADYRRMKDRDLSAEGGRFVAESELVVRRLLMSDLHVWSVLATAPRLAALGAGALGRARGPIFVTSQAVIDAIAGFHVHRGCLAIGERPVTALGAVAVSASARTVLVLEDLVSADNIGACARNAAAFGVDALLFSPRAADPFYRKAVRVSIGGVFQLPIIRCLDWPSDLARLKRDGFSIYGAVLDGATVSLPEVRRGADDPDVGGGGLAERRDGGGDRAVPPPAGRGGRREKVGAAAVSAGRSAGAAAAWEQATTEGSRRRR